jgi:hypothetical protein
MLFYIFGWEYRGKKITMNRKQNQEGGYSVIGLVIVLGIALGSDFLMTSLTHRNAETFSLTFNLFWSYGLIALLLAAASLLLFWFVLNRASRNIWVVLIFRLTGLFIAAFPILYFTPPFGTLFFRPPQLSEILTSPRSFTFLQAASLR